jgi:hypothetical protein
MWPVTVPVARIFKPFGAICSLKSTSYVVFAAMATAFKKSQSADPVHAALRSLSVIVPEPEAVLKLACVT